MITFKNEFESHEHSLQTLDQLYEYDSFLDSLTTIADFGCGTGRDVQWWANLMTRDDPPRPRNYKVYACDHAVDKLLDDEVREYANVHPAQIDLDSDDPPLSVEVDFIWSHNTFQYMTNPMRTLGAWSRQLVENGMLMMVFPQSTYTKYGHEEVVYSTSQLYYNHNLIHMIYMLAVNGFDCGDAYMKKELDDPWIHVAVYKSHEPMNPKTTTWFDLADKDLINKTFVECLNKYGYIRQDKILTQWIDKGLYFNNER